MDGWDISQTTRNARAPGGANNVPRNQPVAMPTMMQESTGSCNVSGWGTLHSGVIFERLTMVNGDQPVQWR